VQCSLALACVRSQLRESASIARVPLLTAGLTYPTAYAAVMALNFVAEEPFAPGGLSDATRVVFFLMELLDRGRRYRRSKRTVHRLLSQIQIQEVRERVRRELFFTVPDRKLGWRVG
jgi:hypothetical protein